MQSHSEFSRSIGVDVDVGAGLRTIRRWQGSEVIRSALKLASVMFRRGHFGASTQGPPEPWRTSSCFGRRGQWLFPEADIHKSLPRTCHSSFRGRLRTGRNPKKVQIPIKRVMRQTTAGKPCPKDLPKAKAIAPPPTKTKAVSINRVTNRARIRRFHQKSLR